MAEARLSMLQEMFNCSMCQGILQDPVSTPCGHNFCTNCINKHWDQSDQAEGYKCPQCNEVFSSRPVLSRNAMLAEVMGKLKQMEVSLPPEESCAGPGDLECDVCTDKKQKAVKYCLTCQAFFCETHIQPHRNSEAFKKHKLDDPVARLPQELCLRHQKPIEFFCRTDRLSLCYSCVLTEHKSHDTATLEMEQVEKQAQLKTAQTEIQQRVQEREKKLEEVLKAADLIKVSAEKEMQDSEAAFHEVIQSMEEASKKVSELIRDQAEREVKKVEGVKEQLEKEIEELKKRDTELSELARVEDQIHFLQNFPCPPVPPGDEELLSLTICNDISIKELKELLSSLKESMEPVKKCQLLKTTKKGEESVYILRFPKSQQEFLKYACQLTLNPCTANEYLWLSEDVRKVTHSTEPCPSFDHPDRFDRWLQVLCNEGLYKSRYYWEVETVGNRAVIGVAYHSIGRKGGDEDCHLGGNKSSWGLFCSGSSYSARHDKQETEIIAPCSSRIGVYLDYPSGALSFYSISDTMTLLHRFEGRFTELLYPGFSLNCYGSSVTICQVKQ
ncbi:E3 ubiquitin-protein ligase TRIM16-like isoform X1 [Erpetoichthys calabaricus]|uniref:E3 ubiquitin-protein ligase TRIM16-like isoform X1 n=1 Tax=Erpetoichthys calabaricus TaxID=27687 RepID=UPI002233F157|nr:E3 ubiquitin-protein ligase TRIM16-like isoform X1 [Erpetoichthys calabaricus]